MFIPSSGTRGFKTWRLSSGASQVTFGDFDGAENYPAEDGAFYQAEVVGNVVAFVEAEGVGEIELDRVAASIDSETEK